MGTIGENEGADRKQSLKEPDQEWITELQKSGEITSAAQRICLEGFIKERRRFKTALRQMVELQRQGPETSIEAEMFAQVVDRADQKQMQDLGDIRSKENGIHRLKLLDQEITFDGTMRTVISHATDYIAGESHNEA